MKVVLYIYLATMIVLEVIFFILIKIMVIEQLNKLYNDLKILGNCFFVYYE